MNELEAGVHSDTLFGFVTFGCKRSVLVGAQLEWFEFVHWFGSEPVDAIPNARFVLLLVTQYQGTSLLGLLVQEGEEDVLVAEYTKEVLK
jgi:hypothetical protein